MKHNIPTVTVSELISMLQDLGDPDKEVYFSYNYGDHWNSMVAQPVTGLQISNIKYSDYHRMMAMALDEDKEDNQADIVESTTKEVVVFS